MFRYFKDNVGMDDSFMLTTWAELELINEVCDDYFKFRGYAIDDNKTGWYILFLYNATGYCVKVSDIECKHMLLEPIGLRFNGGDEVIEFIDTAHNRSYVYCCDGCATDLTLESVRRCSNSITRLACCVVEGNNVLSWEPTDD